jgi:hypothetical protein
LCRREKFKPLGRKEACEACGRMEVSGMMGLGAARSMERGKEKDELTRQVWRRTSPTSPLHLACISPASRLHLPRICPGSRQVWLCISGSDLEGATAQLAVFRQILMPRAAAPPSL